MAASVAVLTTMWLGACASKVGPAAAPEVGYDASKPAVTVDFWYMPYGGPIQDQAVIKETEAFHTAHPNITVNPVRVPWSDALTRLSTASTSSDGPDVTQLGTTWVGGFSALGDLRPYTDAEIAAVGGKDAFAAASWTSSHVLGGNDVTAMPWLTDIRALFYRTDVLAKVGLDPKTAFATWDSFEATLAKIKADGGGIAPLAIGNQNNFGIIHNVAPFVWGAGGDLLAADGTHSLLAEPASLDGVSYYQHLVALYDDPKADALNSSDVPAAFASGIGAVTIDNSQSVADFQANPDRPGLKAGWSTAPMPTGKAGRFGFLGGSNLAILKNAKHPDAAFEWVKYLSSTMSEQRYAVNAGLWPARLDALTGTKLETDPAYAAFRTMIPDGRQYPPVAAWITIETVIAKDFANLWHAETPLTRDQVSDILKKTTADIDAALKVPVVAAT
jgi:multiple sugar transport system substrate-binding protein